MPLPVQNPPAYVQEHVQPGRNQDTSGRDRFAPHGVGSAQGSRIDFPLGNGLDVSLHGVRQDPTTGEATAQSFTGAFRQSLVGSAQTNPGAQHLSPQQFGQLFAARTPPDLQLTTPSRFERALHELGINEFDFIVRFDGGRSTGSLVLSGDLFTQRVDFAGRTAQYSINGEPFREFFDAFTNGKGELSGLSVFTDGREIAFVPSMRINSIIPGVNASVSANVGRAFSSTEGLTPIIGDGRFAPPIEKREPLQLGAGHLYINSYQYPQDLNSLATRLDFEHAHFNGSVLIATGIGESEQTYNFIALRGRQLFSPLMSAQGDVMYAQHIGGGHGVGGEFSLIRRGDRSIFGFGAGFHHYFDHTGPRQAGGWDTNIPQILGTDPSSRTEARGGVWLSW